jgi:hypothetical protein
MQTCHSHSHSHSHSSYYHHKEAEVAEVLTMHEDINNCESKTKTEEREKKNSSIQFNSNK